MDTNDADGGTALTDGGEVSRDTEAKGQEATALTVDAEKKPAEGEQKPGEAEKKPGVGEQKPGEQEKKPGDKDGKGTKEELRGAPEKYEAFVLPQEYTADEVATKEFGDLAKDLDLSQAGAQKLVDLHLKGLKSLSEGLYGQWKDLKEGWRKEARADKEIGGSNYGPAVERGKAALRQFGTPGLFKLLAEYGIGDHPEMIRFASKVGAALGEDTIETGGTADKPKSLADRMFPPTENRS